MGSHSFQPRRLLRPVLAAAIALILSLGNTRVHAAGESILLPGYVLPANTPPGFGSVVPPPILPGWSTANAGFVPQRNRSGLKLIVDNSWPDLPGYRIVRLEFLAPTPLLEERRLRVHLQFQNYNYFRIETNVTSEEIVIPAGQTGVKHQLYFPCEKQLQLAEIRTTENGETWNELSCSPSSGQPNTNTLAYLDLLGLEAKASSNMSKLFINGTSGVSAAPVSTSQSTTQDYRNGVQYMYPVNFGWTGFQKLGDLPNNPLGYDCFKVVLCHAEQLEKLRADHPVQWDALRSWVATGGTLLVWPAKQRDAAATRETQLNLDTLFPQGETAAKDSPRAGWQKQSISAVPEPIQMRQNVYYQDDYTVAQPAMPSNIDTRTPNSPGVTFPERAWFQGTLAVLPNEQDFDTVFPHLQNRITQPLPATALPQVGLPPITMFQVLITLFVILIGPVNYFYCKKKKRMNWLLITVPAGALAITGLLLAYTLMKDGIGVRTWSQSYTVLDQVQKQASTRQQFCLFAGITPGDGLRFRNQVNFADLAPESSNGFSYRYRDTRNWDYAWDEPTDGSSSFADQHMRAGWLPARTLKLYETREFALTQRELKIKIAGDTCQLVNKLGGKVLNLYVMDGERAWRAGELDVDAAGTGTLLDEAQLANLRSTLEQEFFVQPYSFAASERVALQPRDNSLMENLIGPRQINRRVYLATIEHWPELQSGVANPSVEEWGPHIIVGVW